MTYSIVAYDPSTRQHGVAVQTHQPAVGAIVPWVREGVGAVATQASANVLFGRQALDLLSSGLTAEAALRGVLATDDHPEIRQVAIVDTAGNGAVHTGKACIPMCGSVQGRCFSAQANMMARNGVPEAMAEAFEHADGPLALRMLAALEAAQSAGGDIRGQQSAAIRVTAGESPAPGLLRGWDLRVDDDQEPLLKLRKLVHTMQARAILADPAAIGSLNQARRAFADASRLAPSDELTFQYAVRVLDEGLGAHAEAVEMLWPLFERAPQWHELLHRMPSVPADSPLRRRMPLPER